MGVPFTLQKRDDELISALKEAMGVPHKIDIIRLALELLKKDVNRRQRVKRWKVATAAAITSSKEVNQDFQKSSLLADVE